MYRFSFAKFFRNLFGRKTGTIVKRATPRRLAVEVLEDRLAPALLTMDFSNHTGLGFGVGTNQTINQNGVQMSVLSGKYEITNAHELNLKDFGG